MTKNDLSRPLCTGNTTVIIEIDFNIVDGAGQLITNFVSDTLFSQQILNHGCWCAKLNRINQGNVDLGGRETIDEIDRICKEWHQARHCSKTCEEETENNNNGGSAFYQVEYRVFLKKCHENFRN